MIQQVKAWPQEAHLLDGLGAWDAGRAAACSEAGECYHVGSLIAYP